MISVVRSLRKKERNFIEAGMLDWGIGFVVKDYVYYLMIEEELVPEMIFESEQEAIEYAEENAIRDYQVVAWDVAWRRLLLIAMVSKSVWPAFVRVFF